MPWSRLATFDDAAVPKLRNLALARRAGFLVPETLWAPADSVDLATNPGSLPLSHSKPWIIRSGSPTEDTRSTSNAGQFLSLVVSTPAEFAPALARVVAALPEKDGRRLGVVFVQELIQADRAGVTFFDGFYYEETSARGSNAQLTAGLERGDVRRGQIERRPGHDRWLASVHKAFRDLGTLDIEWAEGKGSAGQGTYLLQVRPALFPIKRCETISLANHKEILGDPPSPWMVGLLAEVGRPVMFAFEEMDREIAPWQETYAVELGERAWLNFSAFYRIMDLWGLPRTMVTEGVGGISAGTDDTRADVWRIVRKSPTLFIKGLLDFRTMGRIRRELRDLRDDLAASRTLQDLQRVNARALDFSIRTNFSIMSLLSLLVRIRKGLGLKQAARVVTHEMMDRFSELAARPELSDRLAGLDDWLGRYGHRGPLESDPWQPRFSELRETLRTSLSQGPAPAPAARPQPSILAAALSRPLFLLDELREWFRDSLMRWWQTLRLRILEEARKAVTEGHLDAVDDVFFLRAEDLAAPPREWKDRVLSRRRRWEAASRWDLPTTGTRDEIEAAIHAQEDQQPGIASPDATASPLTQRFRGIGLGTQPVSGTSVRAADLRSVLERDSLPPSPILVVATLEPSWAVVFPRFAGVVVELGGELSHASILLREAGIPAIINAPGAYRRIPDNTPLHLHPADGLIESETPATPPLPTEPVPSV